MRGAAQAGKLVVTVTEAGKKVRVLPELICQAGTAENNQENQDAEVMVITAVPT